MTHPVTAANVRTLRTVFRFQQRALHTWVPKPKLLKVKWALHYTFRLLSQTWTDDCQLNSSF